MKQKSDRKYERFLEEDFQEIAKKHGVDPDELKDAYFILWRTFKSFITDPRMPPIFLDYMGRWSPSLGRFNWIIRRMIKDKRDGRVSDENFWNRLRKIWPIRARMMQEKYGLVPSTWKLWRDKGPIGRIYKQKQEHGLEKKENKRVS